MSPAQIVVLGLVVPAVSYCAVAYGYLGLARPWMMGAFICYGAANVCFVMDSLR